MSHYLAILFSAVLVNNFVLVKFLGLCPFMGTSRRLDTAFGMALATTFVLTLAAVSSWAIEYFLLAPFGLGYLRVLAFILLIAVLVQLVELVIHPIGHRDMWVAVASLGGLALIFGLLLAYAARQLAVKEDPLVAEIDQRLPQTQCAQCGYPGCRPRVAQGAHGRVPYPSLRCP